MARLSVLLVVLLAGLAAYGGYYILSAPDGRDIFVRENCDKCHKLRGEGLGVIDLTEVTQKYGRAWVRDQIVRPRAHDPHPGMPSFAHLPDREVEALLDYIEGKEDG